MQNIDEFCKILKIPVSNLIAQFNLTFLQAHTILLKRFLVHTVILHLSVIFLLTKSPNSVKPKESEHDIGFHSRGHRSPEIENQ